MNQAYIALQTVVWRDRFFPNVNAENGPAVVSAFESRAESLLARMHDGLVACLGGDAREIMKRYLDDLKSDIGALRVYAEKDDLASVCFTVADAMAQVEARLEALKILHRAFVSGRSSFL
ncbi:hypothetical protein HY418_02900 [Candidatus Kaiserbacteria bacterium]|nr:hypothetical protein [Candidatus Kaiserbacteria bacterium]